MASASSLSILFILFLLFAFFTIPIQSEKSQKLTRRNLGLSEQESEEQPIPKPKPNKKNAAAAAQIEQREASDDQPIPKPKPKKKLSSQIEQEEDSDDQPIPKPITRKKNPILDSENQIKPIKPKKSNSTSIPTLTSNSLKSSKLNKTLTLKPTNSTKISKPPKNSTKTLNSTKTIKPTKLNSTKIQLKTPKPASKTKPVNPESIWLESDPDLDSDSDLIAEFRDLPTRIHEALLPDLKKISITSKAYIYKANKNIAENVKPFFGNKFAPKIALAASSLFLIIPLCLVTALFYHLHSYLPLHRLLIFIQAYLAIYFFTLALTAVVTGLEPLRFFYSTSPSSYAWTQAVQTLGYLLYLLVQLIHLVVVFSGGENKMGVKALGLVQMIVGLAVGCHYYAAVFHRAVTGDPPRGNWKVHGIYAGCFLVICLCARAERRKKAYDGGDDGKLN